VTPAKKKQAKPQKALKPYMGAQVLYGGHDGYFMADIFVVGRAAVVKAGSERISGDTLFRNQEFGPPTHHLSDFPKPGMWCPERGIFVVPAGQVKPL